MTCSYTRNSVWRKQNREWLSQGSILQITYTYKSLSIPDSNHLEDLRLYRLKTPARVTQNLHATSHEEKFLNLSFMQNKIS